MIIIIDAVNYLIQQKLVTKSSQELYTEKELPSSEKGHLQKPNQTKQKPTAINSNCKKLRPVTTCNKLGCAKWEGQQGPHRQDIYSPGFLPSRTQVSSIFHPPTPPYTPSPPCTATTGELSPQIKSLSRNWWLSPPFTPTHFGPQLGVTSPCPRLCKPVSSKLSSVLSVECAI